jgi:hypothetical protein
MVYFKVLAVRTSKLPKNFILTEQTSTCDQTSGKQFEHKLTLQLLMLILYLPPFVIGKKCID